MRCNLAWLLSRKITKHVHSSKPASLNRPIAHARSLFTFFFFFLSTKVMTLDIMKTLKIMNQVDDLFNVYGRWWRRLKALLPWYIYYYWSLLYSAVLCFWADSLCLHVILHEWIAFYCAFYEYPPKWCTYSTGMACATWNCCHLGAFCVHHTTMHHVTSCKATYVRCMRV